MSIVSAVNGLYVGQQNYAGLADSVIYNTSAVPENYKDSSDNSITHPFNDKLDIGPRGNNGENGYYIILENIPQGACVQLATMNFGTSMAGIGVGSSINASGAESATTNSVDSSTQAAANTYYNAALTPAQASSVCSSDYNNIGYLLK